MPLDLQPFEAAGLTPPRLDALLQRHERQTLPRLDRLWAYYRNEPAGRPGAANRRLPQSAGLPRRLRAGAPPLDDRAPDDREVVIENDIAWRVHAMVDFLAGAPVRIASLARDEAARRDVERVLDAVLEASGGVALLQDAALLANVFGHADFLLRDDALPTAGAPSAQRAVDLADRLRVELVEARRLVPVPDPSDYRRLAALVLVWDQETDGATTDEHGAARNDTARIIEILSPEARRVFIDGETVVDEPNPLGALPAVHVQNTSQPLAFAGLSEVEPLIPLQDELNTRLSDRAHRVTLQSFRMYLARGIEGFADGGAASVGPGKVWSTDNPDASIESFGGDAASPSEDAHIEQIRQAMDKTSGVTPVAAGVLGGKVGQLTSANALRITLLGLLAKTARKRVAFGRALTELSELILRALDVRGVFETDPADRRVRVEWPDPIPATEAERLEAAEHKQRLGVPRERTLAEIGYAPRDAGVS